MVSWRFFGCRSVVSCWSPRWSSWSSWSSWSPLWSRWSWSWLSWWWSRSSGSSRWSCTVWGSTVASFYCSYYATSHYIKILWHINIPPYVVLRCLILSYFALFNIVLYSVIVHHVGLDCTLCMLYCSLMRFCFPLCYIMLQYTT